jgi:aspartate kinase
VVGVASETGLVQVTTASDGVALLQSLLTLLEGRQASGKQLLFQEWPGRGGCGSFVLSLENLHDFPSLRSEMASAHGARVQVREGVGAVSAIGAGINADFRNLRRALEVLEREGVPVVGVSTSSFRISVLMEEPHVPGSVRALHEELVTEGEPLPG